MGGCTPWNRDYASPYLFHGVDMGKRQIPVILTESEQQALLDQFNTRYVTSHRNKVMFGLMLNTELRVSEAVYLRWENLSLTSGEGKGAKDRTLWVDEDQVDELGE